MVPKIPTNTIIKKIVVQTISWVSMIRPHCLTSNENKNHCVEWIRDHRGLMALPSVNTELKAYGAERKIRCSASECVKITGINR